jgi:hypothetical protein
MVTTSEVPPKETKGRVSPVMGRRPTTPPMLTRACDTTQAVMPAATSVPKRSGACRAARTPSTAKATNRATTTRAPMSPVSSPMMAKMKSVWALGRNPHFDRLAPRPTPVRRPEATPVSDWEIW